MAIIENKPIKVAGDKLNTSFGEGYFDKQEQDLPVWIAKLFRDETPQGGKKQDKHEAGDKLEDPFEIADKSDEQS